MVALGGPLADQCGEPLVCRVLAQLLGPPPDEQNVLNTRSRNATARDPHRGGLPEVSCGIGSPGPDSWAGSLGRGGFVDKEELQKGAQPPAG